MTLVMFLTFVVSAGSGVPVFWGMKARGGDVGCASDHRGLPHPQNLGKGASPQSAVHSYKKGCHEGCW